MDNTENRLQLLRKLVRCVEADDQEGFIDQVECGIVYFGLPVVSKLLKVELSLMLGRRLNQKCLEWQALCLL